MKSNKKYLLLIFILLLILISYIRPFQNIYEENFENKFENKFNVITKDTIDTNNLYNSVLSLSTLLDIDIEIIKIKINNIEKDHYICNPSIVFYDNSFLINLRKVNYIILENNKDPTKTIYSKLTNSIINKKKI